jgi:hypothetical protein
MLKKSNKPMCLESKKSEEVVSAEKVIKLEIKWSLKN